MVKGTVFLFGLVLLSISGGCVSEKAFDEVSQRLENERTKNEALRKEINLLNEGMAGLTEEEAAAQKAKEEALQAKIDKQARQIKNLSRKKGPVREIVKLKGPDMSWAKGVTARVRQAFKEEARSGKVQVKTTDNRLIITLADPLLFELDGVTITVDGEDILVRLAEVLKKSPNRPIVVGAHLDNTPIAPVMAPEFPTAWDFTAARAIEVVRFLQEETRISGKVLSGTAFGATRPVASNMNETGRAQNRRIEISLLG